VSGARKVPSAPLRCTEALPPGYFVDVCACTHLRSKHADRFAPGHGQCLQAGCRCEQFTWVGRLERAPS